MNRVELRNKIERMEWRDLFQESDFTEEERAVVGKVWHTLRNELVNWLEGNDVRG